MEQVVGLLEKLAEQLGTTVEYLWPVLVQQQKMRGIIEAVVILLALVVTGIIARIQYKKVKADGWNSDPLICAAAISFVVFSAVLLYCFVSANNVITHITNPEYWALRDLLRMLKGGVS